MRDHEDFDPDELLLDPDQQGYDDDEGTEDFEPIAELSFSEDQKLLGDDALIKIGEDEDVTEEETHGAAPEPSE